MYPILPETVLTEGYEASLGECYFSESSDEELDAEQSLDDNIYAEIAACVDIEEGQTYEGLGPEGPVSMPAFSSSINEDWTTDYLTIEEWISNATTHPA
ncbi:hypothetical protein BGX28_010221, partial [Mortierella sp. GBA30]